MMSGDMRMPAPARTERLPDGSKVMGVAEEGDPHASRPSGSGSPVKAPNGLDLGRLAGQDRYHTLRIRRQDGSA